MTTIMVDARRYEDQDDCLAAAAHDVATQYDVAGWDLAPRWADDSRARIVLHLPAAARHGRDVVTYHHAYVGGETSLCRACRAEGVRHPDLPALGPVSHGEHVGACDVGGRDDD